MKSNKSVARQNLLVSIVNVALKRRLIVLDCEPTKETTFEFELAGLPVIASCRDIGFDEISVHAICCPTELGRRAGAAVFWGYEWRRSGAAVVTGYLERRTGKYFQSTGEYHGAHDVTARLASVTVKPLGFGTKPTAHGYDFGRECKAVFG
jgi:hypothetical protein